MTTTRKVDGWVDDLAGALFDPIIVMPGGWGDSLPDWLRTRVKLERLAENIVALNEHRELTATDAEAACYLFTASLTAPMSSDWSQIYLYVAGGEMKDYAKFEVPEDIKVESLTESQWRDLRHLKAWIYERRVKHREEKARGERHDKRQTKDVDKELEVNPVQQPFF